MVPVINTGFGSVVAPLLGMSAEQRTPIISHEQTNPLQSNTDGSSSDTGTRSTTVQVPLFTITYNLVLLPQFCNNEGTFARKVKI